MARPAPAAVTESPDDAVVNLRGGVLQAERAERLGPDVETVHVRERDHVGQVLQLPRRPGIPEGVGLEREQVLQRGDGDALGAEVRRARLGEDAGERGLADEEKIHRPVDDGGRRELDERRVFVKDPVAALPQPLDPGSAVLVAQVEMEALSRVPVRRDGMAADHHERQAARAADHLLHEAHRRRRSRPA